jgi:cytochrome oxidase assembly protein ShyY1
VRFLFRPGWLAFIAVVIVFAVSCYTLLAPWQFRRNREQQALNRAIAASYAHPPAPLGALVPAGAEPPAAVEWRQVTVSGQYVPAAQMLVRLRTVDGDPAYEVLTALRTTDGRTVAVDRGYLRPDAANQAPAVPPPPAGPVTVTGRIRIDENDSKHRAPIVQGGQTQVYAADSHQLASVGHLPVDPGYLLLVAGQAGGLGVVPLPETTDGPFLSYAWQWLTFGLMALFGLGYFIRLEILQRRGPVDGDDEPASEPEPAEEVDPLVRRYGKARF